MRPNRREGSSLTTTAVAALLVLVTGCGASTGSDGHACTEIGAVSGVGLTVEQELADDIRDADMQVCWDGTCEKIPLDLHPGQRTTDLAIQGELGRCSGTPEDRLASLQGALKCGTNCGSCRAARGVLLDVGTSYRAWAVVPVASADVPPVPVAIAAARSTMSPAGR